MYIQQHSDRASEGLSLIGDSGKARPREKAKNVLENAGNDSWTNPSEEPLVVEPRSRPSETAHGGGRPHMQLSR